MTFRVSDLMVDVLSASCPSPSKPCQGRSHCPDPSKPPCQGVSGCPDPSKPPCPNPSVGCPDPSKPTGGREMAPLDGLSTLRRQLRHEVRAQA